jgi:hypothetical protein
MLLRINWFWDVLVFSGNTNFEILSKVVDKDGSKLEISSMMGFDSLVVDKN